MAEQHAESTVLTVDRDFKVYRKHDRQVPHPTRLILYQGTTVKLRWLVTVREAMWSVTRTSRR